MPKPTPKSRRAFRDAVRDRINWELGPDAYQQMGGHRYGFYLRGPGWPHSHNGFYVPADGIPCLVVHRKARLSAPKGRHVEVANNGPKEVRAYYIDLRFVDENAANGPPSEAFLKRLLALIKSASGG